jgi:hypothetical protein
MIFFTTVNKYYFNQYGYQLIESFKKNSESKLIIYSEDLKPYKDLNIEVRRIKNLLLLEKFKKKFRIMMGDRYKFLPYHSWMDKWIIKLIIQEQFLNEFNDFIGIYIDSDSIILNKKFDNRVADFIKPAKNYDIGLFRRQNCHLHPETGFIFFNLKSIVLRKNYKLMIRRLTKFDFSNLPTLTDCSAIDSLVISNKIKAFDFCEYYHLKKVNPIYESNLRTVFIHLKGSRKGKFSIIKKLLGFYI